MIQFTNTHRVKREQIELTTSKRLKILKILRGFVEQNCLAKIIMGMMLVWSGEKVRFDLVVLFS